MPWTTNLWKFDAFNKIHFRFCLYSIFVLNLEVCLAQPKQQNGYCAPYNGKVCKSFINTQVWYSRDDKTGGWINEKITSELWKELIETLPDSCMYAAQRLVRNVKKKIQ